MDDQTIQYLPFHAINEFMRPDFRLSVIRTALTALPTLPENRRLPIDLMTRQAVKVPGFRNSAKAPAALKARPMAEAFEKSPELVAAVLSAWSETHTALRQQVYDLLSARGWELLPPEADRTQLPGFLPTWPKGEDFDLLNQAFQKAHPDDPAGADDISLMVVWLSGRLPYQSAEEQAEPDEGASQD